MLVLSPPIFHGRGNLQKSEDTRHGQNNEEYYQQVKEEVTGLTVKVSKTLR